MCENKTVTIRSTLMFMLTTTLIKAMIMNPTQISSFLLATVFFISISQNKAAGLATKALKAVHGTEYKHGNHANTICK